MILEKKRKKKQEGQGWFVKYDAGNVPLNNAIFNSGIGAQGTGQAMGEELTEDANTPVIDDELRKFINEHADIIRKHDYAELYDRCPVYLRGKLSSALLAAKINFLSYLDKIPEYCFLRSDMTSIEIPDNIISVGNGAFNACMRLKTIVIPNGVAEIEAWAFANCATLINVAILGAIRDISYGTFSKCDSLTRIVLPNTIIRIASEAFGNCNQLKEIHYKGTVDQWKAIKKSDFWDNGTGDYKVYCSDGVIAKGN